MYIIGNNPDYNKALYIDYSSIYSDFKDFIVIRDGILYDSSGKQTEINNSSVLLSIKSFSKKTAVINLLALTSINIKYPNYHITKGLSDYDSEGNIYGIGNIIDYNVDIGNFNILGHNNVIGYSTRIGNFNNISSSVTIMNNCKLGNRNSIFENSSISEFITIGNNSIVGPGECLFEDLDSNKKFQHGVTYKNDNIL